MNTCFLIIEDYDFVQRAITRARNGADSDDHLLSTDPDSLRLGKRKSKPTAVFGQSATSPKGSQSKKRRTTTSRNYPRIQRRNPVMVVTVESKEGTYNSMTYNSFFLI